MKYGISFHCYADDTQLYLPLKWKDANSVAPLLDSLEDESLDGFTFLSFFKFNEGKIDGIWTWIEVIIQSLFCLLKLFKGLSCFYLNPP